MEEFNEHNEKEIALLARYDNKAFDYIYEKYMPKIHKYVMYRVFNKESAEDIVSIVFTKAMKNLAFFKWRKIPFSAWLYRIAYNEICNHVKREKKYLLIEQEIKLDLEESFIDDYSDPDKNSFKFIHTYLKKLPIHDQDLITLRFFEKRSFTEIAQILGKNESTLRVNLYRALKKLESLIPKEVYHEALNQLSK